MNFAEIEKEINTLAKKATDGTISIDEMAGGSFTISNGGVYGSLLSTPIINPPQVWVLDQKFFFFFLFFLLFNVSSQLAVSSHLFALIYSQQYWGCIQLSLAQWLLEVTLSLGQWCMSHWPMIIVWLMEERQFSF